MKKLSIFCILNVLFIQSISSQNFTQIRQLEFENFAPTWIHLGLDSSIYQEGVDNGSDNLFYNTSSPVINGDKILFIYNIHATVNGDLVGNYYENLDLETGNTVWKKTINLTLNPKKEFVYSWQLKNNILRTFNYRQLSNPTNNIPQVIFGFPGQLMIREFDFQTGTILNENFDSNYVDTINSRLYFPSPLINFHVLPHTNSEIYEFEYIGPRGTLEVKTLDTLGRIITSDTLNIIDSDFSGPAAVSYNNPIIYKDNWYLIQTIWDSDNPDNFAKSNVIVLDTQLNLIKEIDLTRWFSSPEIVGLRHISNNEILITNQFTNTDGRRTLSLLSIDLDGNEKAFFESLSYDDKNYINGSFQFLSNNSIIGFLVRRGGEQHMLDVLQFDSSGITTKKTLEAKNDSLRISPTNLLVLEDNNLLLSTYVSLANTNNLSSGLWNYTIFFSSEALDVSTNSLVIDKNLDGQYINIFPNPFKEEVNISIIDLKDFEVEIFDISGNLILKSSEKNQNLLRLETNKWPTGSYIFKVISNRNINSFKLIKN